MLTQDTIQKILGINERVFITKEEMAKQFVVTFSPHTSNASANVIHFGEKLRESLLRIGVQITSYEDSWVDVPVKKRLNRFIKYTLNNILFLFRTTIGLPNVNFYLPLKTIIVLAGRRRIKKGICVVCLGEHELNNLQMQHITSFKDNSIITVVDFPDGIDAHTPFKTHFDKSMKLFAYHMTNIVISVDDKRMMVYNFNASHPVYSIDDGNFDKYILEALIPKVVAPISPHKLSEFNILDARFDPNDKVHLAIIDELKSACRLFSKTNLYPAGKKIDEALAQAGLTDQVDRVKEGGGIFSSYAIGLEKTFEEMTNAALAGDLDAANAAWEKMFHESKDFQNQTADFVAADMKKAIGNAMGEFVELDFVGKEAKAAFDQGLAMAEDAKAALSNMTQKILEAKKAGLSDAAAFQDAAQKFAKEKIGEKAGELFHGMVASPFKKDATEKLLGSALPSREAQKSK
jgi:hypothetical protein